MRVKWDAYESTAAVLVASGAPVRMATPCGPETKAGESANTATWAWPELARTGGRGGRRAYRCICMSWLIGSMLLSRLAMIQSEPPTTRPTMRMPKASARMLLVLSGELLM